MYKYINTFHDLSWKVLIPFLPHTVTGTQAPWAVRVRSSALSFQERELTEWAQTSSWPYRCSSSMAGPHNSLRCRLAVKCVPHPKSHSPPEPWTPPLPALWAATVLIGVWLPLSLCGEAAPQGIEGGVMHWGGCGMISASSGQALVILLCHYEVLPLLYYKQSTNVCPSF